MMAGQRSSPDAKPGFVVSPHLLIKTFISLIHIPYHSFISKFGLHKKEYELSTGWNGKKE